MVVLTVLGNFETFIILALVIAVVFLLSARYANRFLHLGQDCQYDDWGPQAYGSCSRDCQGGFQYRTRGITQLPKNGGKPCDANQLIQSRSCNDSIACGQPCIPGNPANYPWEPCPTCIESNARPVQWKVVEPVQLATYMGRDCTVDEVLYSRPCSNVIPPCPPNIDCELAVASITDCSEPCGPGVRTVYQTISVFPSGQGAPCDFAALVYQEPCEVTPCGDCDSLFSNSVWSTCNAACGPGVQIRFREPRPNDPNDAFCPFFETQSCSFTACENSTCSAPSVDLIQSLCLLSCSGLPIPPFAPGVCSTSNMFSAICGSDSIYGFNDCAVPTDCSLSTWSSFSDCSVFQCNEAFPDGGLQTRVRQIVSEGTGGGAGCSTQVLYDTRPCNNLVSVSYIGYNTATNQFQSLTMPPQCIPLPCEYSAFYSVSTCSDFCGGTQTFNRSVTQFPSGGSPDQCSSDPNFYVSFSACGGPNDPSCQQCIYATPFQFGLTISCATATELPPGSGQFYSWADVNVVSYSSNPNVPCFPGAFETCSLFDSNPFSLVFPGNVTKTIYPGFVDGNWDTVSCSAYLKTCPGPYSDCPTGCNGLPCSGNGSAYGLSESGNTWCSCSCFAGWTGDACNTTTRVCPIGPTGQTCNGLGICDSVTGTCSCFIGDSADCSSFSANWCWIYANYDALYETSEGPAQTHLRKFLGALPLLDTPMYSFTEQQCFAINDAGNNTAPVSVSNQDFWLTAIDIYEPSPISYGQQNTLFKVGSWTVQDWNFTSAVKSSVPGSVAGSWRQCNTYIDAPNPQTEQWLNYFLNQNPTFNIGTLDFSQFRPRVIPSSAPSRCESLLEFLAFTNVATTTTYTTQTFITVTDSLTAAFTVSNAPVNFTTTCYADLNPSLNLWVTSGLTSVFSLTNLRLITGSPCPNPVAVGTTATVLVPNIYNDAPLLGQIAGYSSNTYTFTDSIPATPGAYLDSFTMFAPPSGDWMGNTIFLNANNYTPSTLPPTPEWVPTYQQVASSGTASSTSYVVSNVGLAVTVTQIETPPWTWILQYESA